MSEPLHSTGTTRAFRTASKVIHLIELILSIICVVGFFIAGIICIIIPLATGLLNSTVDEEVAGGALLLSTGITLVCLAVFLWIPEIIYQSIAYKQVQREGHKQFLGLAIAGGLLGDEICMVFAVIIYIFEGRLARREELE